MRSRREFLRIQQGGREVRRYRSKHLLLLVAEPACAKTAESRLGITVTTKIDKRAARRNRLKRRIREQFRRISRRLLKPVDLVVIALGGATELDYHQLGREIRYLLRKAGLIRPS